LASRLAELGAAALVETLTLMTVDAAPSEPQDHKLATYAPKIDRGLARLAWDKDAATLSRWVRAFDPEPGAWTTLDEGEVKLFGARAASGAGAPGTVLNVGKTLVVASGVGAVEVTEVQPAGKKRMPVAAWTRGRGVAVGQRLI
jgi:methionyl-tRNA formyltransferase